MFLFSAAQDNCSGSRQYNFTIAPERYEIPGNSHHPAGNSILQIRWFQISSDIPALPLSLPALQSMADCKMPRSQKLQESQPHFPLPLRFPALGASFSHAVPAGPSC